MSDFCQIRIQDWELFSGSRRPNEENGPGDVIAGQCCVIAGLISEALEFKAMGVNVLRGGLWKPRTHPGSFEGVGEEGAQWLREAGKASGMKTVTEVANARHVEVILENGIDAVWIGARTTGNPFLVQEIAEALRGTGLPVFVKNPLVPDPELWSGAIERFVRCGNGSSAAVRNASAPYTAASTPTWRASTAILHSGRYL